MNDIAARLKRLYPGIDTTTQVIIASEGGVSRIAYWDDSLGPQPTEEELLAVSPLPAEYDPLVAELQLEAYAGLSNQQAADALNARDKPGKIPVWELVLWSNAHNLPLGRIALSVFNAELDITVRLICNEANRWFTFPDNNVDFEDAAVGAIFDAIVAAGIISSDEKAAIVALAGNRSTRCEQLGLPPATAAIVALARG